MRINIPFAALVEHDPTILNQFYIAGDFNIGEEIVLRYGDLTPVYQNPDYLKRWIAQLGKQLKWSIDKLYAVTLLEYNPIENYDRKEITKEDRDTNRDTDFQKGSISVNGTQSHGDINISGTNGYTDENTVAAFNSSTYQPSEHLSHTGTDSQHTTQGQDANTESTSFGKDTENEKGTDNFTRDSRTHGNIGVTTTQKMMQEEIEIAMQNYIDSVCKLYADLLFIQIW